MFSLFIEAFTAFYINLIFFPDLVIQNSYFDVKHQGLKKH